MIHQPYDLYYNGESAAKYGVYVVRRPDIPAPEEKVEYVEVRGRNGSLTVREKAYQDIEFEIELNYMAEPELWAQTFREVKKWLLSDGSRELRFTDDPGFFRKVKGIAMGTNERTSIRIGKITPSFRCDPFEYLMAGRNPVTDYTSLYNPYDTAAPAYRITGEGVCTLTVNEKTLKANVGQNLTIDTDLQVAYRTDSGEIKNTAVSGKYEDLYLLEGENHINITKGFTLQVIPNWRCL